MARPPQTWHYGVIARYWAEFNTSGPEIEYFRRFVEAGQPALDVACGTGRLLIPYLRAGLDVDGCDISADMLALCRERAEREGLTPTLYAQAMHELNLPRRYRTIFVCGGLGVGSSRERDLEALRRFHEHLQPGGTLVLDNEVPYANAQLWKYWVADEGARLPEPPPGPPEPRRAEDGSEYLLQSRALAVDPLAQSVTLGTHVQVRREGELLAEEQYTIDLMLYFKDELVWMIERAGFRDVEVRGAYDDTEPAPDDDFLVFVGRR